MTCHVAEHHVPARIQSERQIGGRFSCDVFLIITDRIQRIFLCLAILNRTRVRREIGLDDDELMRAGAVVRDVEGAIAER